jgi:hypothetical protein
MFDPARCLLDTWCGKREKPANYRRSGTRYECLRIGYGRGKWDSRQLPEQDLNNIPYLNRVSRERLIDAGIETLRDFLNRIRLFDDYRRTKIFLEELGFSTPKKFNKIVLFLFEKGIPIEKLPRCKD